MSPTCYPSADIPARHSSIVSDDIWAKTFVVAEMEANCLERLKNSLTFFYRESAEPLRPWRR
jgi:hypothetical protein